MVHPEIHSMSKRSDSAPPAEMSSRQFRGHEGIRLAADAWGDPLNPPVVLFHGGGQTRHSWSETASRLAADGWYSVSVDLRGHGESEWSQTGEYHHIAFALDVIAIAEAFDRPPVLVGASLGGIASLLATSIAEAPIASGLVLVDIATQMERAGATRIIDFMRSRPDGFSSVEEAADAVAAYNPHRKRPSDLSGLRKNLRQRDDGRFRWHWDPRFLEGPSQSDRLPPKFHDPQLLEKAARALTIPTLLVRGRLSDLLSQEGADAFLEQVPHARFADVSGAGHMVAGDRNDRFAAAVRDFLADEVREGP
jgi:pimeloyl-ACP methyl ester carboxylesterase